MNKNWISGLSAAAALKGMRWLILYMPSHWEAAVVPTVPVYCFCHVAF